MRLQIATRDPEQAHEWLRAAYTGHSARLSGRTDAFSFAHSVADCGSFKIGVARHTMTLHGEWEPLGDTVLFSHLLTGRFSIASPRSTVVAGPGDVFSYDLDARMAVEWSDIRMAQVRMARSAVNRVAAELVGEEHVGGGVNFDLSRPIDPARAARWKGLMQYAARDVAATPGLYSSPLIVGQLHRLIVATALETFPNTTMYGTARPVGRVWSAALRRAVAHIEEHAAEDVDLTDIAAAASVGTRALQRSFRAAMDTTPVGYLRLVRMRRAHEELLAADAADGTTVAGVAHRWGFRHPGRFAAAYQARYGRWPRDTLLGSTRPG